MDHAAVQHDSAERAAVGAHQELGGDAASHAGPGQDGPVERHLGDAADGQPRARPALLGHAPRQRRQELGLPRQTGYTLKSCPFLL